jgi:hypothetical protein
VDAPIGASPDPEALPGLGREIDDAQGGVSTSGEAKETPRRALPGQRRTEQEEPGVAILRMSMLAADEGRDGELEQGAVLG